MMKRIMGMSNDLNDDLADNNYKWTNISERPKYLIGREALTIFENKFYILRKPIKYGFFNFEYNHQSVVDDITKIVEYCLINILQINKKSFSNFQIVLLIPDLFIKQQVKSLVNIFLKTLGFKSIFLHLESVMSSFGAALQSACVLDIGSDKINVCCVDEGVILEDSLIRKNFGCDDLTKVFYMMLKRKNSKIYFPYDHINMNNNSNNLNQSYFYRIIEKLKEAECEFPSLQNPTAQFIPKNSKIWLHKKNSATKMFNITLSEAAYLTPLTLLNVDLFSTIRKIKIPSIGFFNDIYSELYSDPEDTYEELIQNLISENNALNSKKDENNFNMNNTSANKNRKGVGNNFYNNTINENDYSVEEIEIDQSAQEEMEEHNEHKSKNNKNN